MILGFGTATVPGVVDTVGPLGLDGVVFVLVWTCAGAVVVAAVAASGWLCVIVVVVLVVVEAPQPTAADRLSAPAANTARRFVAGWDKRGIDSWTERQHIRPRRPQVRHTVSLHTHLSEIGRGQRRASTQRITEREFA